MRMSRRKMMRSLSSIATMKAHNITKILCLKIHPQARTEEAVPKRQRNKCLFKARLILMKVPLERTLPTISAHSIKKIISTWTLLTLPTAPESRARKYTSHLKTFTQMMNKYLTLARTVKWSYSAGEAQPIQCSSIVLPRKIIKYRRRSLLTESSTLRSKEMHLLKQGSSTRSALTSYW